MSTPLYRKHKRQPISLAAALRAAGPPDFYGRKSRSKAAPELRRPLQPLPPNEQPRSPSRKKRRERTPPHPLAIDFDAADAASTYLNTVATLAETQLNEIHQKLEDAVQQVHILDKHGNKIQIDAHFDGLRSEVDSVAQPLSEMDVRLKDSNADSNDGMQTTKLGIIMQGFDLRVKEKTLELQQLLIAHENVVRQIVELQARIDAAIFQEVDQVDGITNHSNTMLAEIREELGLAFGESLDGLKVKQKAEEKVDQRQKEAYTRMLAMMQGA